MLLHSLEKSWRNRCKRIYEKLLNDGFSDEPTDETQKESAGIGIVEKSDQKSMATEFHVWVYDDQQPRGEISC